MPMNKLAVDRLPASQNHTPNEERQDADRINGRFKTGVPDTNARLQESKGQELRQSAGSLSQLGCLS